jgi:hypothetical protein
VPHTPFAHASLKGLSVALAERCGLDSPRVKVRGEGEAPPSMTPAPGWLGAAYKIVNETYCLSVPAVCAGDGDQGQGHESGTLFSCTRQARSFPHYDDCPSSRPVGLGDGGDWGIDSRFSCLCATRQYVHVTGTKGKGTVCELIRCGLLAAGRRVGTFTRSVVVIVMMMVVMMMMIIEMTTTMMMVRMMMMTMMPRG